MKLVSIKTVSEFLMVKVSTLYSWVHQGTIPFHKLNGLIRFDMEEVIDWIKSSRKFKAEPTVIPNKGNVLGIDNIVKQAIDSVKNSRYNSSNGKPGQMQGLRKEV